LKTLNSSKSVKITIGALRFEEYAYLFAWKLAALSFSRSTLASFASMKNFNFPFILKA
jgi:hypothetical protein